MQARIPGQCESGRRHNRTSQSEEETLDISCRLGSCEGIEFSRAGCRHGSGGLCFLQAGRGIQPEWPVKRVEYSLPAFQGSSGVHATINGVPIDVVTYHQSSSHFVRIYATGDENTVMSVYSAAAGVFDSSLSDNDLQAAIAKYKSSEVKNSRDMLSTLSTDGKIRSDYIMGSGSNREIFIDAEV